MRILWITNIVFPEAMRLLKGNGALKASGGWMLGAAENLVKQEDVSLVVATVSPDVKELTNLKGDRIEYYLLPYGKGNNKYNSEYERYWLEVQKQVKPDIIHIHGSEFTHGLAYVRACGNHHVVVSIQGLVGIYERYYYSGLTKGEILCNFTLRSILGRSSFNGRRSFYNRGALEKELFQSVEHIIGRTSWDRAHSWAFNPNAQYHKVGETLRPEFYNGQWDFSNCIRHSIFLSQANYSVKGLHMVLRAMPLVLRQFPDAVLRVAGSDITKHNTFKDFVNYTDYGRIIYRMIKDKGLKNVVTFTGPLDGEGMKQEYLLSNVFVCPSTIENSPNSLGEAQILGVPVISSYVGGVVDMMSGDENHLYRFEEIEMLAAKICEVFSAGDNQPQLYKMREMALLRHNPERNNADLLNVYKRISKN
jgi:glycosyltransferase involved in cell wall biosynthesis